MNFKILGSIIISLAFLFMVGCNQSQKEKDASEEENQEQTEMSGQAEQQDVGEVSDEELDQFLAIIRQMQSINQSAQQEMVSSLQSEGIDVQRYSEIHKAQQSPDQQVDATEEEMRKFEEANQKIQQIQQEAQKEMEKKIKAEGMTQSRYEAIGSALQQDTVLMQRLQEKMQQQQPVGGGMGN
ncbi:MAG: DUF4168 domain-containing protein [Bacteroidales bacterium]|nr:DUF4168 domain-containing protein [Bacteroidales bacterium]MCF8333664.1 DUF4168 domain-containing protein [Bacteroidales bacterium]